MASTAPITHPTAAPKPAAYKVETTLRDGRVELSSRYAYSAIAASIAVRQRRHPDVAIALVVIAA